MTNEAITDRLQITPETTDVVEPDNGSRPKPEPVELNPFDPDRLRLTPDFHTKTGVKKALLTVPVKKPMKEWWIQVHPDPEYLLETWVLELKDDRETYLIDPLVAPELVTESTVSPRAIFTAVNRQRVVFLWPVRLPGVDGKIDDWSRSAMEAAKLAQGKWVRVAANMDLGAYEVFEATGDIPDPQWPTEPLEKLLSVGFKDKLIQNLDHPVLKRLRGEE